MLSVGFLVFFGRAVRHINGSIFSRSSIKYLLLAYLSLFDLYVWKTLPFDSQI